MTHCSNGNAVLVSAFAAAAVLLASNLALGDVIYVDVDADGGAETGASWDNALTDLQVALSAAASGDELWVATGTYASQGPAGNPTTTFQLKSGVAVYGGFLGDESTRDQRDPTAHPTVLGGNTAGGGRIVTGSHTDATAILDGFVVTGGIAADDAIGGVGGAGGGIFIEQGSPTIVRCAITNNTARLGSGVMLIDASPTFMKCDISSNSSAASGEGGGIYARLDSAGSSILTLIDCAVNNNTAWQSHYATGNGAGVYCAAGVHLVATGCTFSSNFTPHNQSYGNATRGGAIYLAGGPATITRCGFFHNISSLGAAIHTTGDITCVNSIFSLNRAVEVGCVGPECNGAPDVFSGLGGGLYMAGAGNGSMVNCTLAANWAAKSAAGAWINGTVENCLFWGNKTYPVCCGEAPLPIARAQLDGSLNILYSDVQGLFEIIPGEDPPDPANFPGSFESDPLFLLNPVVSDLGHGTLGDLHLQAGSPCIDAGSNLALPPGITTDYGNKVRLVDDPDAADTGQGDAPLVDVGAHEVIILIPPDLDGDGDVDQDDVAAFEDCASGPMVPVSPGCEGADLDADADGDQSDFGLLQACITGPGNASDPSCFD